MTPAPSIQLLKGLKILHGVMSSTLAALSATLIRDRLIPYQLGVIGTVGALFILVGLLITLIAQAKLRKYLRLFVAAACVSLVLLTLLQIYCVVTVENYGNPPAAHHFLIGYSLTEQGKSWVNDAGSGSPEMAIGAVGYKRIPVMYGTSYSVVEALYPLTYIAFVVAVVLTLGGILTSRGGRAEQTP
jgi:hypothetical protein